MFPARLMNFLKLVLKVCNTYLHNFFCWKEPEQKFLIFAQGRTGSTLLVELLNQISEIHCEEEILSRDFFPLQMPIPFPRIYLKGYSKKYSKHYFGFKLKIFHLTEQLKTDPATFFEKNLKGYRIIFLYRQNIPMQVISNLLAYHNSKYHLRKKEKFDFEKIHIDPEDFIRRLNRRIDHLKLEIQILSKYDYLKLCYETDLIDENMHQKTVNKICDYLGLESSLIKTTLTKSNSYDVKDIITNYDEIKPIIEKFNMTIN
jgi:hypothetical protein